VIRYLHMWAKMTRSPNNKAALMGMLLTMPLIILNAIVVSQVQPFYAWLEPWKGSSPINTWPLMLSMALLPIAFFVAVRPAISQDRQTRRNAAINILVGLLIGSFAVLVVYGLAVDTFSCDFLQIRNCD
jgi:hypothetical protein